MAWTYHTSRQHHRRKKLNAYFVQQQQHQQIFRLSNFPWINSLLIVFICTLFIQCSTGTNAQVRIAYSMTTHTDKRHEKYFFRSIFSKVVMN